MDHTSWARGDYVEDYAYDLSQALPDNLDDHYGSKFSFTIIGGGDH